MPDTSEGRGKVVELEGHPTLRFVRTYEASRADVWSAITEPDRQARWAFRAEMEPRGGGALRFDLGEHGEAVGTILVWDEPSHLEYEWVEGDTRWHIRFVLIDGANGTTVLTFDHLQPDVTDPSFAAGWHWHLDRLAEHLDGSVPAEVLGDEKFDRLMAEYQASPATG
ncbi:MAG: SRPBCC family protein [Acidimicrobiia bacterium]|nr:SRPBCC family protein [Acidimicrobiia bacterium]